MAVRRRLTAAAGVLVMIGLAAACAPAPPGDFYDAPDPLPFGKPGKLIWAEPMTAPGPGLASARVMYHSRDAQDRDVAVTGTVSYPTAEPPTGGWPVVSYGHGAEGMAPQCAPSRRGATGAFWGVQGVAVASDYYGLGPNGQRHALFSGKAEGHSMIDLIRAVRQIPGVGAGRAWIAIGVSQGGHASLFAGERATSYAPELSLKGVVAAEPTSGFLSSYPGDNQVIVDAVTVAALYGLAVDHPEIDPDDYVTPQVAAASSVIDTGCLAEMFLTFAAIPHDQLFTNDPRTTPPAVDVARANDPGNQRTDAPILLVQGTADAIVVPARTAALRTKLCANGSNVAQITIQGGTHDDSLSRARPQVEAWIRDRLAGTPATRTC